MLLAMLGYVRAGQPACGPYGHEVDLEHTLAEVPYPERGTEDDLELVAWLGRLTGWRTNAAAELLDTHGLAALTGDFPTEPGGNDVVPLTRRRH